MKKFISRMITLTLVIALAITFTACSFDVGGGVPTNSGDSTGNQTSEVTKTPEELATEEFEAKYAEYTEALNSQTKDEDGNVVEDCYTRSSVTAMQTAMAELEGFTTEGKTAAEINAATAKIEAALANLETVDSHIDGRLQDAITKLKLYQTTTGDASGEDLWFKDDGDGGNTSAVEGEEGAYRIPDKGVEKIEYDNDTNTAVFYLIEEDLNKSLMDFLNTNVLVIFQRDFADLAAVSFHLNVDITPDDGLYNPVPQEFTIKLIPGDQMNGMYLGAGLIAICAGMEQEIYDELNKGEDGDITSLLKTMTSKTYNDIKGAKCTATVKFEYTVKEDENTVIEYFSTATFTVKFTVSAN